MAVDLLNWYEDDINSIILIPSEGGCFELTIDGTIIFSKLQAVRHPNPGEIKRLMSEYLSKGKL